MTSSCEGCQFLVGWFQQGSSCSNSCWINWWHHQKVQLRDLHVKPAKVHWIHYHAREGMTRVPINHFQCLSQTREATCLERGRSLRGIHWYHLQMDWESCKLSNVKVLNLIQSKYSNKKARVCRSWSRPQEKYFFLLVRKCSTYAYNPKATPKECLELKNSFWAHLQNSK